MKKKFCIIVPIWKMILQPLEIKILERISDFYSTKYDLFLVLPSHSNVNFKSLGFENSYFDKNFFSSVSAFNKFLMSKTFYERFLEYEYIHFNQPDTIIFKDNLDVWYEKQYSYIGGPSYHKSLLKKIPIRPKFFCNGGLSLRRVQNFIAVLDSKKIYLNNFNFITLRECIKTKYFFKYFNLFYKNYIDISYFDVNSFIKNFFLSEDVFWTFFAKLFIDDFKLPKNALECANFSLNEGHEFYLYKFKVNPYGSHYYNEKNCNYLNKLFLNNKLLDKEEISNLIV